jgi:hypothetical protein
MFKMLGITDEVTDCDCCGKRGLKCTVALESDQSGIVHYGRDCAGMALFGRKSAANTRKVVSMAQAIEYAARMERQNKLARVAQDKNRANYLYACTRRTLENSVFLYRGGEVVRAQAGDDCAWYLANGFTQ